MVAKTTDTTAFNLNLTELVEESFERCGAEARTGYDFRTARRSLNLLLADMANRGINLWTIEQGSVPMVAGTATYNLPVDTVDLMDHVIRTGSGTSQADLYITRIPATTYASIPNKNTTGRPIELWIDRQSGATDSGSVVQYPTVTVWPVPDVSSTYTLVYWRLRRLQDAGDGVNGMDLPFRFLPAITSGLAYYLSLKIPGAMERNQLLKAQWDEDLQRACEEDRDKSPLYIRPRIIS